MDTECSKRYVDSMGGTLLILLMIVFRIFPVIQSLTRYLPGGRVVSFGRLLMPMDFLLSVLGALGLSILFRRAVAGSGKHDSLIAFFVSSGLLVVVLTYLIVSADSNKVLNSTDRSIRVDSLVVSILTLLGGIVIIGIVLIRYRHKSAQEGYNGMNGHAWSLSIIAAGLSILFLQGVLLIPPASTTEGFSHRFYPTTSSITALQAIVSGRLVGDGPLPVGYVAPTMSSPLDAFMPETNIPYGINYFGAYDPMLQKSYMSSWKYVTSQQSVSQKISPDGMGWFVPSFTNAAIARVYGIQYLISVAGKNGKLYLPSGTIPVFEEPGYTVSDVPNSHRFTLVNPDSMLRSAEIGSERDGRVQGWHWDSNNRLTIEADASHAAVLLARISSVPGWHATINGKPAKLAVALGTMLSLKIPAGKSVIRLTYWPSTLTYGIILAVIALLVLLVLSIMGVLVRLFYGIVS